jgi:hypothetical protein
MAELINALPKNGFVDASRTGRLVWSGVLVPMEIIL